MAKPKKVGSQECILEYYQEYGDDKHLWIGCQQPKTTYRQMVTCPLSGISETSYGRSGKSTNWAEKKLDHACTCGKWHKVFFESRKEAVAISRAEDAAAAEQSEEHGEGEMQIDFKDQGPELVALEPPYDRDLAKIMKKEREQEYMRQQLAGSDEDVGSEVEWVDGEGEGAELEEAAEGEAE